MYKSLISKYLAFSRVPILQSSISSLSISESYLEFSPQNPIPKFPNICTNCKYYFNDETKLQVERCSRFGSFSLVDGSIYYSKAETARRYKCKGTYYESYIKK